MRSAAIITPRTAGFQPMASGPRDSSPHGGNLWSSRLSCVSVKSGFPLLWASGEEQPMLGSWNHEDLSARAKARGLLSAALLLAASFPISAQTASAPDFSGPWGRNMFNLEPPDDGPGPLVNLRRLGAKAGTSAADGDPIPLVGDYNSPILKPEAAEVVRKNGEFSESGHDIPDPSNQCGTYSPPFLFSMMQGMQLIQRKDDILILYTQNAQVRRIRLNSAHPRELTPVPMGDSVGHYEGDTLVIDTVGIKREPYTVADRFGTPQSDAMHVVERYRLIDAREGQRALDRQLA